MFGIALKSYNLTLEDIFQVKFSGGNGREAAPEFNKQIA